jgi:hypothetical protein
VRDRDEAVHALWRVMMQARVTHVEKRLPVERAAWFSGESRTIAQPALRARSVAEDERGLECRRRDSRMQREQSCRAAGRATRGTSDELVNGGLE